MMKDLSHVGEYAKLNNSAFRLMKKILPGAYTFILEGAREVPNRFVARKKKNHRNKNLKPFCSESYT